MNNFRDYLASLMEVAKLTIHSQRAEIAELMQKTQQLERKNAELRFLADGHEETIERLERENAVLREDKERLDWIASRQSTQLVYFTAAGWAIIKASGGDLLHDCNIHDLRAAIDDALAKEAKP